MKTIVCLLQLTSQEKEKFRSAAEGNPIYFLSRNQLSETESQKLLLQANMIIGNPPPELIRHSPNLELLQLQSAGTNAYLEDVLSPQTFLANATGAYGLAISEYLVGMVFQIYKKLSFYYENQHQKLWKDEGTVRSVFGKTVLVVGAGDIGTEFARRMKALGCHTIGVRRKDLTFCEAFDEMFLIDHLDSLLPRADIVSLSLPSTAQTYHLFDDRRISLMKPEAILLNVGRGDVLDTNALIQALNAERLSAAALDVTDPEPLPKDHPLWNAKNLYLTPHISGGNHLEETTQKIHEICLKNLTAFLHDAPLGNLVDFQTGYKAK